MIFSAPAFLTAPFVAEQYGQYTTFRAIVFTCLHNACRWMFSRPARRKRLRYIRRSGSSSSTRAQVFHTSESRRYKKSLIAHFTYGLEDGNGMLKVADVEYWDNQFDICIMAYAINRVETTSLAKCILLGRPLRSWSVKSTT
jgi:hypothetical protein